VYKTIQTAKKYEKLYPNSQIMEFNSLTEANAYLSKLKSQKNNTIDSPKSTNQEMTNIIIE